MNHFLIQRKARYIAFTLLIVFIGCVRVQAQSKMPELINNQQFRKQAQAAVDSIYNFDFKGADQKLSSWEQKYPNHPLWELIKGIKYWWSVLSDLNDKSHDKKFFTIMKKADYQASELLQHQQGQADALIVKAVSNAYIARQYADRDAWINSLRYARRAYQAYKYLKKEEPNLPDLKLADGLKLYYSAYLPKAYPIVKTVSWFLPSGNEKKGLQDLREAAKNSIFAQAEALYFLGDINFNYEHRYNRAANYFQQLYSKYPHNNYYARLLIRTYYHMHRYDEVLQESDKIISRWKKQDLPYSKVLEEELFYYKGRALFKQHNFSKAFDSFQQAFQKGKALAKSNERAFYVQSAYYAGESLFQQHKYQQAVSYFKAAKDGKAADDFRKKASQRLDTIKNKK